MTTPTARADGSGKITRDAVLAAALDIIDRDGADALAPFALRSSFFEIPRESAPRQP